MVKVVIENSLVKKLERKFQSSELKEIKQLFLSLEENPFQGKLIGTIGPVILKEKKYKSFRFYFIISKQLVIVRENLESEVIRFIEMSKKNNQERVIKKLREILRKL